MARVNKNRGPSASGILLDANENQAEHRQTRSPFYRFSPSSQGHAVRFISPLRDTIDKFRPTLLPFFFFYSKYHRINRMLDRAEATPNRDIPLNIPLNIPPNIPRTMYRIFFTLHFVHTRERLQRRVPRAGVGYPSRLRRERTHIKFIKSMKIRPASRSSLSLSRSLSRGWKENAVSGGMRPVQRQERPGRAVSCTGNPRWAP